MPSNDVKLRVTIFADGRTAVRAYGQVADASQKTAKQVQEDSKKQTTAMDTVGKGAGRLRSSIGQLAGAVGLGGLAFGFADVIKAGMAFQQQQVQLQQALKATGHASSETLNMVRSSAEKLAQAGGFAVPAQMQALTNFIRETGSATKAVQANQAATNLARGTGLAYSSAQRMVQMALAGTTGRLQRYLGVIQPVKTAEYALAQAHRVDVINLEAQAKAMGTAGPAWLKQQELIHGITPAMAQHAQLLDKQATAQIALTRIQQKYGGATAAYSKTAAGALNNLRNSFDILIQHLGAKVLPVLTAVVTFINKNRTAVLVFIGALTGLVTAYAIVRGAQKAWNAATTVTSALFGKEKSILAGAKAAWAALTGTQEAATVAEEGTAGAQLSLVPATEAATVATTEEAGAMGLLATMMDAVPIFALIAIIVLLITHFKQVKEVALAVFNWLKGIVMTVVNFIKTHWKLLLAILLGPFALLVLFVISNFRQIKHWVSDVIGFIKDVWSGLLHILEWPFLQAWKVIKPIIDAIKSVIGALGSIFGGGGTPHALAAHQSFGGRGVGVVGHQLGGIVGLQSGGVLGGWGGGDQVPAMLERGEGVIRKEAVQAIGSQAFNAINQTGSIAGAGSGPATMEVTMPLKVYLGQRVVAEQTMQFAARKSALSGHFVAG